MTAGASVSVRYDAESNYVALVEQRLLLFTRTRLLTKASLDGAEAVIREQVPKATAARPVGAFVVLPGDAGLSRHDLLERQRKMFDRLKAERTVYSAMVVLGSSPQCVAMRAVVRLFLIGSPTMQLFSEVEPAARWLARAIAMPEHTILDAFRSARLACESAASARSDA